MTLSEFVNEFVQQAKALTMSGVAISLRVDLYNELFDFTSQSAFVKLRFDYQNCHGLKIKFSQPLTEKRVYFEPHQDFDS